MRIAGAPLGRLDGVQLTAENEPLEIGVHGDKSITFDP